MSCAIGVAHGSACSHTLGMCSITNGTNAQEDGFVFAFLPIWDLLYW